MTRPKSRWKRRLVELAFALVLCGTGDAARGAIRGQAGSDGTQVERPVIPDAGTVHGYRGYAGTLGILSAAGLVIPAGIASIIYLLYVYYCKKGKGDQDEMIVHHKDQWEEFSSDDVILANHLWSKRNGWPEDEEEAEEEESLLLEGAIGKEGLEKLSLCDEKSISTGDTKEGGVFATMNGPGMNVVTPECETFVDEAQTPPNQNDDPTSTAEVYAPREDHGLQAANLRTGDRESVDSVPEEPVHFTQKINMQVVNQVHVELRLTDLGDENSKYVSKMQLYLRGNSEEKADKTGRNCLVDVNDNTGCI